MTLNHAKNETERTPKSSRWWVLTISHEKMNRAELTAALDGINNAAYIGQLEQGKDGYRHWQLLLYRGTSIRFRTVKEVLPTAHIEPRKGSRAQAIAYVTKEETRVEGEPRLEKGTMPTESQQGKRKDLDLLREDILYHDMDFDEAIYAHRCAARHRNMVDTLIEARDRQKYGTTTRNVTTTYIWGPAGAGKTSYIFRTYAHGDFFRVTDYQHPFDNYRGQQVLVLDEFTGDGQINLQLLNNICDVYPMELPARYANKQAAFTEVVLVSNIAPWETYPTHDAEYREAFARRLHEAIYIHPGGKLETQNIEDVRKKITNSPRCGELLGRNIVS